jgi:uracil-DNA glycosylase
VNKNSEKIEVFLETLANTMAPLNSVNPWDYSKKENQIRRNNLRIYLDTIQKSGISVLLVGEAPGYRGTRRTGIPFSSEKIVLTHPFFTTRKEFSIENKTDPIAEASASIVWKTMDELQFYPLIWASFPFHPHEPGNDLTNRAPTKDELILGQAFLKTLIKLFKIKTIIAVGRAAEKTLKELDIPIAAQIRHPSHGGANQFRDGLKAFTENKNN